MAADGPACRAAQGGDRLARDLPRHLGRPARPAGQTPEEKDERMKGNVTIDRTFDAPRELVWSAWTDPAQLAEWWGPDQFHTPLDSVDIDLRPGGHFHLSMIQTDNGTEYPVRFQVVEVVEHELLVLFSPAQPELGLNTDTTTRIEFADEGGKTRMKLKDGPYEGNFADMTTQGWNQMFGKLDRLFARGAVGEPSDGR